MMPWPFLFCQKPMVRAPVATALRHTVTVCDADPARSKTALEKNKLTGIPEYLDYNEMIRKEQPDVVHICTPSGAHGDPALAAMEAGIHVISEKPLEITLEKIDRMIETSQRKGVRLAGIFQNRWNEANRALKAAAAIDMSKDGEPARVAHKLEALEHRGLAM